MYQNEMYLIVVTFSSPVGRDRLTTVRRALTLIGLDAVARYAVDWDLGEEFTVLGFDGHVTRQLTDDEFTALHASTRDAEWTLKRNP